ncbi:MAG: hypothetical protein MZV49_25010 [Rhodopseudomonas palustris]|nr:hypothetical protein [Rhodopseudomonas palustris]
MATMVQADQQRAAGQRRWPGSAGRSRMKRVPAVRFQEQALFWKEAFKAGR